MALAFNYTYQNAIDFAKPFVKNVPVTSVDSQVVDFVTNIMWTHYPWKWACATIGGITVTDGTQDYSSNNDMWRILRVRIVRTDTTPDQYNDNVIVYDFLPPDLTETDPMSINGACLLYVAASDPDTIRLNQATNVSGSATYQITGDYQKEKTRATDANLGSAQTTVPDNYFHVLCDGVLARFYQLTDDPRADNQMRMFMQELALMARAEEDLRAVPRHPAEPLGASGGWRRWP